jgi:DNA polymerase-4
VPRAEADKGDLADTDTPRLAAAQSAIDTLRARFGEKVVTRGRGFTAPR